MAPTVHIRSTLKHDYQRILLFTCGGLFSTLGIYLLYRVLLRLCSRRVIRGGGGGYAKRKGRDVSPPNTKITGGSDNNASDGHVSRQLVLGSPDSANAGSESYQEIDEPNRTQRRHEEKSKQTRASVSSASSSSRSPLCHPSVHLMLLLSLYCLSRAAGLCCAAYLGESSAIMFVPPTCVYLAFMALLIRTWGTYANKLAEVYHYYYGGASGSTRRKVTKDKGGGRRTARRGRETSIAKEERRKEEEVEGNGAVGNNKQQQQQHVRNETPFGEVGVGGKADNTYHNSRSASSAEEEEEEQCSTFRCFRRVDKYCVLWIVVTIFIILIIGLLSSSFALDGLGISADTPNQNKKEEEPHLTNRDSSPLPPLAEILTEVYVVLDCLACVVTGFALLTVGAELRRGGRRDVAKSLLQALRELFSLSCGLPRWIGNISRRSACLCCCCSSHEENEAAERRGPASLSPGGEPANSATRGGRGEQESIRGSVGDDNLTQPFLSATHNSYKKPHISAAIGASTPTTHSSTKKSRGKDDDADDDVCVGYGATKSLIHVPPSSSYSHDAAASRDDDGERAVGTTAEHSGTERNHHNHQKSYNGNGDYFNTYNDEDEEPLTMTNCSIPSRMSELLASGGSEEEHEEWDYRDEDGEDGFGLNNTPFIDDHHHPPPYPYCMYSCNSPPSGGIGGAVIGDEAHVCSSAAVARNGRTHVHVVGSTCSRGGGRSLLHQNNHSVLSSTRSKRGKGRMMLTTSPRAQAEAGDSVLVEEEWVSSRGDRKPPHKALRAVSSFLHRPPPPPTTPPSLPCYLTPHQSFVSPTSFPSSVVVAVPLAAVPRVSTCSNTSREREKRRAMSAAKSASCTIADATTTQHQQQRETVAKDECVTCEKAPKLSCSTQNSGTVTSRSASFSSSSSTNLRRPARTSKENSTHRMSSDNNDENENDANRRRTDMDEVNAAAPPLIVGVEALCDAVPDEQYLARYPPQVNYYAFTRLGGSYGSGRGSITSTIDKQWGPPAAASGTRENSVSNKEVNAEAEGEARKQGEEAGNQSTPSSPFRAVASLMSMNHHPNSYLLEEDAANIPDPLPTLSLAERAAMVEEEAALMSTRASLSRFRSASLLMRRRRRCHDAAADKSNINHDDGSSDEGTRTDNSDEERDQRIEGGRRASSSSSSRSSSVGGARQDHRSRVCSYGAFGAFVREEGADDNDEGQRRRVSSVASSRRSMADEERRNKRIEDANRKSMAWGIEAGEESGHHTKIQIPPNAATRTRKENHEGGALDAAGRCCFCCTCTCGPLSRVHQLTSTLYYELNEFTRRLFARQNTPNRILFSIRLFGIYSVLRAPLSAGLIILGSKLGVQPEVGFAFYLLEFLAITVCAAVLVGPPSSSSSAATHDHYGDGSTRSRNRANHHRYLHASSMRSTCVSDGHRHHYAQHYYLSNNEQQVARSIPVGGHRGTGGGIWNRAEGGGGGGGSVRLPSPSNPLRPSLTPTPRQGGQVQQYPLDVNGLIQQQGQKGGVGEGGRGTFSSNGSIVYSGASFSASAASSTMPPPPLLSQRLSRYHDVNVHHIRNHRQATPTHVHVRTSGSYVNNSGSYNNVVVVGSSQRNNNMTAATMTMRKSDTLLGSSSFLLKKHPPLSPHLGVGIGVGVGIGTFFAARPASMPLSSGGSSLPSAAVASNAVQGGGLPPLPLCIGVSMGNTVPSQTNILITNSSCTRPAAGAGGALGGGTDADAANEALPPPLYPTTPSHQMYDSFQRPIRRGSAPSSTSATPANLSLFSSSHPSYQHTHEDPTAR